MAWAARKWAPGRAAARVEPVKSGPGSKEAMTSSNTGSMLLTSMASLSPSQLDHAIMEMLNIRSEDSAVARFCQGACSLPRQAVTGGTRGNTSVVTISKKLQKRVHMSL